MACTSPLQGYRAREANENGKHPIVFSSQDGGEPIDVPCGQCISCRLEKSRQWSMRIMHEASLSDENCFITLTYDDKHLPHDWSLNKADFQKFIRSLRKRIYPQRVRYYHCGEYGDLNGRPHYHAALFGFSPADGVLLKKSASGYGLYQSDILDKSWNKGFVSYGSLDWDSASYIASYVTKKINGEKAEEHYKRFHPSIGLYWLQPEYATMSLKPAIGHEFYKKHQSDFLRLDSVSFRGRRVSLPKAYDRILQKERPDLFDFIKTERSKRKKIIGLDDIDRMYARNLILESQHDKKKGQL